ncbi:glycosyltransferase [Ferruginibacter sp.]
MTETSRKIKLLILTPTLQCGGSERYVSILCNNIDTQKFEILLAVLNNETPFYNIHKNITVIDLQVKQVRHSFFKIRKLVKEQQPDIIYSTANHLNIYLALFKKMLFKNTIMVARESSVVSINTQHSKSPAFYNGLIKKYYNRFDRIICQSQYMQQDLVKNYNVPLQKTIVLHNPVQEPTGKVVAAKPGKFITVARLSSEKGIDRLIKAIALLTIDFTWYIIGEGPQHQQLQQLVNELQLQKKVVFMGQKTTPFDGMEDAVLFLMGSHYEGFPNALLEAAALGIPAIAFDVPGGINEIITDGANGHLVKDGDVKAFAAAIEKATQQDYNRPSIAADINNRFSVAKIIPTTEQLFVQLIKHSSVS